MGSFPEFMKNELNHIDSSQQNTKDIDGYYFEGKDGSQMAYWTCYAERNSKEQVHEFDEYTVCVAGQYVEIFDGVEHVLNPGDEVVVPKGTPHHGRVTAGTRTIHCLWGKRISNS
jgi:quercetin dioxygenase-like cupin family protein